MILFSKNIFQRNKHIYEQLVQKGLSLEQKTLQIVSYDSIDDLLNGDSDQDQVKADPQLMKWLMLNEVVPFLFCRVRFLQKFDDLKKQQTDQNKLILSRQNIVVVNEIKLKQFHTKGTKTETEEEKLIDKVCSDTQKMSFCI